MKKVSLFLLCSLFAVVGCEKQSDEVIKVNDFPTTVVSGAFKFALKSVSSTTRTQIPSEEEFEKNMVKYMVDEEGPTFETDYNEAKCIKLFNKKVVAIDAIESADFESPDFNSAKFVDVFFKSLNIPGLFAQEASAMSLNASVFMNNFYEELETNFKRLSLNALNADNIDKNKFTDALTSFGNKYLLQAESIQVNLQEKVRIKAGIQMFLSNIIPTIGFAFSDTEMDSGSASRSWFKKLCKYVAKAVVVVACLVGGAVAGIAVGTLGGEPGMGAGAVVGIVGGYYLQAHLKRQIDKW